MNWLQVLIALGFVLLSVLGGWPLIVAIFRWAATNQKPGPPAEDHALRGGRWIGFLERLSVTLCVISGQPALIAVVVATKGLGRYPQLRGNPTASEQFVIGTLASLTWASVMGVLSVWMMGLVN